jgi:serine/threonine-protein kinase RsbW
VPTPQPSTQDGTSTQMASHDNPGRADVELRLPADGAYASVLRTTTAGLAARLDFTMDDIEELRIAIGEALALVLPEADPGADLTCRFHLGSGTMTVEVETEASDDPQPDHESFAWQVLDTLASDAAVDTSGGVFTVRFTMSSQVTAAGAADDTAGADL